MPAKKIIDAVMSTLPVIGSSMATATAGPMPGRTPTAVPSTQPTKAHSRLIGETAVANPWNRAAKMSMSDPAGRRQARQADPQQLGEQPVHRRGEQQSAGDVAGQRPRRTGGLPLRPPQPLHGQQ